MLSYSAIGLNRFRNSKETKTVPPGMDPVAGAATSILDVFVGHARQALCPPCQSWMNLTATHDHILNERIEWW